MRSDLRRINDENSHGTDTSIINKSSMNNITVIRT